MRSPSMSARARSKWRWASSPRTMKAAGSSWSSAASAGISRPRPTSPICSAGRARSHGGCRARRPRRWRSLPITNQSAAPRSRRLRGVQISKGTLDVLMDAGWVRPAGRREGPGRPLLYATTSEFLTPLRPGLEARFAGDRRPQGRRPARPDRRGGVPASTGKRGGGGLDTLLKGVSPWVVSAFGIS